jgi:SprT-like family
MCELVKDDEGKYRRIRLKLSEPILKFRPREDTVNTLLHEAIHAYFFITTSWRHSRGEDGTGHGTGFLLLADAISNHGGYEITVYHAFHDEVESYRTHVWQCDGPCKQRPPYFGLVKRSMNRAPSKSDFWWQKHQEECGGTYTKIMEPELTKAQIERMSAKERAGRQKNKIDAWVQKTKAENSTSRAPAENTMIDLPSNTPESSLQMSLSVGKRKLRAEDGLDKLKAKLLQLSCPICDASVTEDSINGHLDKEHLT